jgi:hypothetical protein
VTNITAHGAGERGDAKGAAKPDKLQTLLNSTASTSSMAQPIGPQEPVQPRRPLAQHDKKKGCKQQKCSKWKGGKCRCGKD